MNAKEAQKHIHWVRMLHRYMTPYVSRSPRAAYFNYRDLDLGINGINGTTSYLRARIGLLTTSRTILRGWPR